MSVSKSSKFKVPITRLPLSNIENIYRANTNLKSHNQTPQYSFRNTYISKERENPLPASKLVPHKSMELKGMRKQTKSNRVAKQHPPRQPKRQSEKGLKLRETLDQLRTEVGMLHSKSMTMEQLHKQLSSQVKQLKDNCKVSKFMKDQTGKKMKVLDGLTRENSVALKELLRESKKRKSKSTIDCKD